jgi:hypothetical protein
MNLSSNSFWADINFGKDIGSLSNNINYNNKPKHHSIYFSKLVEEREGENIFVKYSTYLILYIDILKLLVRETIYIKFR